MNRRVQARPAMLDAIAPERWHALEPLLDAALELEPEARAAYLGSACAGDPALRADLERLLQFCEQAEGFLARPGAEACAELLADLGAVALVEGARVGPYRLLSELGHGGMGAVYLAERADGQFEQRVALKLVRGAVSTDDHLVRRFLEERQILASLDHPHIARLLDGGVTAEGLPWFAMEYVQGVPFIRSCDAHELGIERRIGLFLEVCDAVQYAHRNLVIHRDLKPSNVLVTEAGEVKLLDFGIAKLLSGGEGSATTLTGPRALTPEYASPEQIRGDPVTTASDVYSLGVILYELFSGERPYRLTGRGAAEIERAVLAMEPERPSATVKRDSATPAAARATTADRLQRRLRGDLDTIVLMALRKEPARRYGSVQALADDLRRHLAGLPVTARSDTLAYRAEKFIGRHRLGVAAAASIAVLLVGAVIVTWMQAARIAREREKAEQVSGFLIDLFGAPDPWYGRGESVTVREMLDSGAARIGRALIGQPDLQSDLLSMMGRSYRGLGLNVRARSAFDSALAATRRAGGDASRLARDHMYLALNALDQEQYAVAESLGRSALALERRRVGPHSPDLTSRLLMVGYAVLETGRAAEAEPLFREAVAIQRARQPIDPLSLALALRDLAHARRAQGDFAGAEGLYREALALRRAALGDDHPDVATLWASIARTRHAQGDTAAPALMRQAIAAKQPVFGDRHLEIADDRAILAGMLADRGEFVAAESLYRAALPIQRELLPRQHGVTAASLLGLGRALLARGEPEAAEQVLSEAVAMLRAVRPFDTLRITGAESALARARAATGHPR